MRAPPLALALAAGLAAALGAAAEEGPLRLAPDDAARLARGETLVREVRDPRSLALVAGGERADRLRRRIAELRPNYLSEVILEAPDSPGAMGVLARSLADVEGYVGIRYWSKRQERYYDLFDRMSVSSRKPVEGGEEIEVRQHMEPFSDFGCRYAYRLAPTPEGESLLFECENTSPIAYSYRGIEAVAPGGMRWALYAFPAEGKILFYGVGAVKAFDLFGVVRDRLKTSFLGRIEAFFGAMSARLGEAGPRTEAK